MVTGTFSSYCSQFMSMLFQNPFIQANPIALVFFISLIPFIPKSEFFIPLVANGGDASGVIIASTAGNIISEIILYYLAKHGSSFLTRKEQKKDKEIKDFLHKYSFLFFFFSPFIPIGTDVLVIFAGIKRVKIHHFILQMSAGFAIKNIATVLLVLQGSWVIPQILKICS